MYVYIIWGDVNVYVCECVYYLCVCVSIVCVCHVWGVYVCVCVGVSVGLKGQDVLHT